MQNDRKHRWLNHPLLRQAPALFRTGAAAALLALAGVVPLAMAATPSPPPSFGATQCAASRYGSNLGCTANDVSITGLRVVGDTTACEGGTEVTLDMEVSVNFATPDRYDVGIFLANDGKDPTITPWNGGSQSCTVSVLPNSSPFLNLDPGPYVATDGTSYTDSCGDGNSGIGGGTGNGILYMTGVKVACQSMPGADGKLYIPFVVSWDNQSSPTGDICTSNLNPYPNTQSKCNAPTVTQGSVEVVVLPTITMDDGRTYVTSGTHTDYTIVITNTTGAALSNVVFTDPAAPNLTANSVTCSASDGATCPLFGVSVGAMQGAGITIPSMPAGSRVTFTVNATLKGSPPDTVTNTAYVTTSHRSGSASDTDTFYDGSLSISPATLSKTTSSNSSVTYTYTLYNFSAVADTVSLSAASSQGWTTTLSTASLYVPAAFLGIPGSATFSVTVQVPAGAAVGTLDLTTLKAVSGRNASKASASAITTVAELFTFTPDNSGAAGPSSAVWYSHTAQNNASVDQLVMFSYAYSGDCAGWSAFAYLPDKVTPAAIVTLPASGGSQELFIKVNVPSWATVGDECTVITTATTLPGWRSDTVRDTTTVKSLILYSDTAYTQEAYVYPQGDNVYGKAFGLTWGARYYFVWYDPSGTVRQTSPLSSGVGTQSPDTYPIAPTDPEGTWQVEVWKCKTVNKNVCTSSPASGDTLFSSTRFYVGPDHLNATYSGANVPTSSTAVVDLVLHDRYNHRVPVDASGEVVEADPPRTEDPLKITVTVTGSAQIVSTTLKHAVISGQTVTGELDDDTGRATLTLTDTVAETVSVIPRSYASALKGSPGRDEPASVTFVVASLLDHIRLEHAGTALTCEPAPVTVKACADAACTALATLPVTVTLSPAAGWSDNGFTFTGSTTVTLSSGTPQTVTLGTSDVSPLPSGATPQCYVGATANCNLTFADSGFLFSGAAGELAATVPAQVAGVSSGTWYLRAVKKSDSSSACVAALTGARSVDFAYECNNPAACYGSNLMSVNGGSATTIQRNDNGAALGYTPVSLTFDADGNAPFTFNYGDAGLVRLHARKAVNGALLLGATNGFVVKPHHFTLSDIKQTASPNKANPAAAGPGDAAFVKAGESFSVTVTAMTAGGTATPSYGRESPKEGVKLAAALIAHADLTANPALAFTDGFGDFSAGSATGTDFSWGEVGIITLRPAVADENYLGAGDVTETASGNVGRFYPAQFAIDHTVTPGCGGFTYAGHAGSRAGQKFTLSASVEAQNSAGAKTVNYSGAFARLPAAASVTAGFSATANPASGQVDLGTVATWAPAISGGSGTYYNNGATYRFNSEGPPQTMHLSLTARDLDGATGTETDAAKATEYRFGRMRLMNANGSELIPLSVPFQAEYLKAGAAGNYYVTNSGDNCTPLTPASHLMLSNGGAWQAGDLPITPSSGTGSTTATLDHSPLSSGDAGLAFSAPGRPGYVDIRSRLATDFPWLLYDWSGSGSFDQEATGRATFGLYKGSARHIYLRELY